MRKRRSWLNRSQRFSPPPPKASSKTSGSPIASTVGCRQISGSHRNPFQERKSKPEAPGNARRFFNAEHPSYRRFLGLYGSVSPVKPLRCARALTALPAPEFAPRKRLHDVVARSIITNVKNKTNMKKGVKTN